MGSGCVRGPSRTLHAGHLADFVQHGALLSAADAPVAQLDHLLVLLDQLGVLDRLLVQIHDAHVVLRVVRPVVRAWGGGGE